MPKISVLIPTYNCAQYLNDAIESVLCQTITDYEIIVVDNKSTDNTLDIISNFQRLPNFFYYNNERNLGMGGNWNRALQYASGEYIKFVCADDKLHADNLKMLSEVLDEDSSVTIVASYFQNFGSDQAIIKHPFKFKNEGAETLKYNLLYYNSIGTPTQVMFRKSSLWVGTFKTDLVWILDGDMWHRLLSIGNYYCVPQVLSYIRCHEYQGTVLLSKDFSAFFAEYTYLKNLQMTNGFNVLSYEKDLNLSLRSKVLNIIDKVPRMLINNRIDLVRRAFLYAYYENMIVRSLFKLLQITASSIFTRVFNISKVEKV